MNNHELWQAVLSEIELSISKANFITWFKNTNIISQKDKKERKPINFKEQLDLQECKIDENTNLNPRYNFDSFIVASFNELAFAASQSVIKDLGKTYNPLFIYGGVGVGKTHLIQAIGNEILKSQNKNVIYVSSEQFSADLISSISSRTVEQF